MIIYELKMGLNKHISVRHDIFYNFSSGVMNVENKEKSRFL